MTDRHAYLSNGDIEIHHRKFLLRAIFSNKNLIDGVGCFQCLLGMIHDFDPKCMYFIIMINWLLHFFPVISIYLSFQLIINHSTWQDNLILPVTITIGTIALRAHTINTYLNLLGLTSTPVSSPHSQNRGQRPSVSSGKIWANFTNSILS